LRNKNEALETWLVTQFWLTSHKS